MEVRTAMGLSLPPDNFSTLLQEEKSAANNSKKIKKATQTQRQNGKKNSNKASKKAKYRNGNLSDKILINEIFPHAKKDDRRSEWIELYNKGQDNVNLGNWRLDDAEGDSKPYFFPNTVTIPAGGFLVIMAKQSKISLSNERDTVRLFDYQGKKIDDVEYQQAPAGKSYSRTIVAKEDGQKIIQWLFDEENTPGKANPDMQEISGVIASEPVWGNQYTFVFLTSKNKQINIIFHESLIQGPLAKATFLNGTRAKLLVKKAPNAHDAFELKQYEILDVQKQGVKNKNIMGAAIVAGIFAIGGLIFASMKLVKYHGGMKKDVI